MRVGRSSEASRPYFGCRCRRHCPLLWNTSKIPKYLLVQGSPPFPERTDSPSSPVRCCVSLERELPVQRSPSIVIRACKTSWSMGRYGLDSCHVYVRSTDDTQAMISVVPLCVSSAHSPTDASSAWCFRGVVLGTPPTTSAIALLACLGLHGVPVLLIP